MIEFEVVVGDLLEASADVMLCTANPWLNMSGGVNGAILGRGNMAIQQELHAHLAREPRKYVPAGTVVETSPGNLNAHTLLHCVAIDGFYGSSPELVTQVLRRALRAAGSQGHRGVAMPTLATGYGPLDMTSFARGVLPVLSESFETIERLSIHVLKERHRVELLDVLTEARHGPQETE